MEKNQTLLKAPDKSTKESAAKIIKELKKNRDLEKAKFLQRFFKTGKGEYGEGDQFLGIVVPIQRKIAQKNLLLPLGEIEKLLTSPFHEIRLTAVFILCYQYQKSLKENKKKIFQFYLQHTEKINGWDLVDASSHKIVGDYLLEKDKKILFSLVQSKSLWQRRISIIATFTFIRNNHFSTTIQLSKILLQDKEDLMHKAVGWMLREIGKREEQILIQFLEENVTKMPRVMLRYAIEKFSKEERKKWLSLK